MSALVAAAISAGTEISELSISNAMQPTPLTEIDGHMAPPAEIVMIAEMTGETHEETPIP